MRLLLVIALLAGCGDDDDDDVVPFDDAGVDGGDAGADAGPDEDDPVIDWLEDGEPPVAAPAIPWLADGAPPPPTFTCAQGWREIVGPGGAVTCDPWPESGLEDCAAPDEAHFPGESGCRPVGRACPDDGWPADLPGAGVWYVRAGEVGGDGSFVAPFGTIAEAIAAAADGETVAVAAGQYDEALVIDDAISVRGACARDTVITSSDGEVATYVVDVQARDVELADLSIADSARAGIHVTSGSATLSGLVIARVQEAGILIEDRGRATLSEVSVRDVEEAGWAQYPDPVGIFSRGALEASLVSVSGAPSGIVTCGNDADVTDTVAADNGDAFHVCGTPFNHPTHYARVVAERPSIRGFTLIAETGEASVTEAVVRDHTGAAAVVARCLNLDAEVRLEHVWVDGATFTGINLTEDGCETTATLSDIVVERVQRNADGFGGVGIRSSVTAGAIDGVQVVGAQGAGIVVEAGSLEVTNALIRESGAVGVTSQTESSLGLTDVAVTDTPLSDTSDGYGIQVSSGSALVASRVAVLRTGALGILVENLDQIGITSFTGSDVVVQDVRDGEDDASGWGVVVAGNDGDATAELTASVLEGGSNVGYLCQNALCTARDLRISGFVSGPGDGLYGGGFEIHGGTLDVERAVLEDLQGSALALFDKDGALPSATVADLAVHGVVPMTCAGDGRCPGLDAATGLYLGAGDVDVRRVLVDGAGGAGIQCSAGTMDVADAVVTASAVGTNFQGCDVVSARVDTSGAATPDSTEALPAPVP